MDMLTYISALLAVFLLLGLFALVMRQVAQGGLRTRGLSQSLSRALPASIRRFLPRALHLQAARSEEGFAISAVRMIDARRKIVAVDHRDKRYILLLSHQQEQLLDTLILPKPPIETQSEQKSQQESQQERQSFNPETTRKDDV